jgi:carbamoyl-phosphate synthase large subunit
MNNKITVLVTGVGGGGHGEQIVKALKLAPRPYRIIGTDMSSYSKGLQDVDIAQILPPASDPAYLDKLIYLCRKYDVKALFHGSEPELKVMSEHRDILLAEGLFLPINPSETINICMDKILTMNRLKEAGLPVMRFVKIHNLDDLKDINYFPVVLKPSVSSGASANSFIAQDDEELRCFANYLLKFSDFFIVQEYIGTPDDEYTVGVLSDMQGNIINSIAVKRNILSSLSNKIKIPNRTGRKELGPVLAISSGISQGEIGSFPEVTSQCEEIAKAVNSCGPLNIQCRYVNGKVYTFEINPRFSGTTSLRAMVEFNEPDILIRKHVQGENIQPNFSYKHGTILRGLNEVFISYQRK